jgi:hypothetical protein
MIRKVRHWFSTVVASAISSLATDGIKYLFLLAISAVGAFFTWSLFAAQNVAVVIADDNDNLDPRFLFHIRVEVENKISSCSGFKIASWYDHANVSRVEKLAEGLAISNSALFSSEQALEIGKLVQAQQVLFVSVPYLKSVRRGLPGSQRRDLDVVQVQMAVALRLQDMTTGLYPYVRQEEGSLKYFPDGSDEGLSALEQEKLASAIIDKMSCPST